MSELLLRLFVPKGDAEDPAVRTACGKLSGIAGIILNALLVAGKLTAGLIAGSVAIVGDALNNLSDAASSLNGARSVNTRGEYYRAARFGRRRRNYLSLRV